MGVLHSAPFTAGLRCDGCRFFGILGLRDGRAANTVSFTCSRPEQRRHISPWEIKKCHYMEEVIDE